MKWIVGTTSVLSSLNALKLTSKNPDESTTPMPVLFLGHGSPMNAIEDNEFVKGFKQIGTTLKTPSAIVCISAHWETQGTRVTGVANPRTIHDFGGFPKELFEVQYPAPGHPILADQIMSKGAGMIAKDQMWGLDHGAWSVLIHLFPKADIPVLQISLDKTKTPEEHYQIAKKLAWLRDHNVLIVGSGNIIHNLGLVAWDKLQQDDYAYDWAKEVKDNINHWILDRNHTALQKYNSHGQAFSKAIPTPEHYLPLLYTLALQRPDEDIHLFNDKAWAGSLSMTSLKIG